MKMTIESTDEIVTFDGVLTRIWKGKTEGGVEVHCHVAAISPQTHDEEINDRFARELIERHEPSIGTLAD